MKTTITITVEQLKGDNQRLLVNTDPKITEDNIINDPTIVTANRLLSYIQAGMEQEYIEGEDE